MAGGMNLDPTYLITPIINPSINPTTAPYEFALGKNKPKLNTPKICPPNSPPIEKAVCETSPKTDARNAKTIVKIP